MLGEEKGKMKQAKWIFFLFFNLACREILSPIIRQERRGAAIKAAAVLRAALI